MRELVVVIKMRLKREESLKRGVKRTYKNESQVEEENWRGGR